MIPPKVDTWFFFFSFLSLFLGNPAVTQRHCGRRGRASESHHAQSRIASLWRPDKSLLYFTTSVESDLWFVIYTWYVQGRSRTPRPDLSPRLGDICDASRDVELGFRIMLKPIGPMDIKIPFLLRGVYDLIRNIEYNSTTPQRIIYKV